MSRFTSKRARMIATGSRLSQPDVQAADRRARTALYWCGAALLTMALTPACAGGEGSATPRDANGPLAEAITHTLTRSMLVRGRKIYLRDCAPCHGPEGRGDGPSAAALDPKPRDHSDGARMDKLTDQRIADIVRLGGVIAGYPNMPSISHIRGDDMIALIAHVRTLGHPGGVETVTINPE